MKPCMVILLSGFLALSADSQVEPPAPPEAADPPVPVVTEVTSEPVVLEPPAPVETASPAVIERPSKRPVFAVFLPERIERAWFWYAYTEEIQHIVQSAIEKALLNAGLQVVEVSRMTLPEQGELAQVMSAPQVVRWGAEAGADYVITGTATADPQSEGSAYGVRVVRATAMISARVIRVSDSRVVAVQDTSAMMGGAAFAAAAREALRKAGDDMGRKLAQAASGLARP